MVKEKAAAANQQAKEIAYRVSEIRKTPEKKNWCLVCHAEFSHGEDIVEHNRGHSLNNERDGFKFSGPMERSKQLKKRLKKIRLRIKELVEEGELVGHGEEAVAKVDQEKKAVSSSMRVDRQAETFKNFKNQLLGIIDRMGVSFHQQPEAGSQGLIFKFNTSSRSVSSNKNFQLEMKHLEDCIDKITALVVSKAKSSTTSSVFSSMSRVGLVDILIKLCVCMDSGGRSLFPMRILSKVIKLVADLDGATVGSMIPNEHNIIEYFADSTSAFTTASSSLLVCVEIVELFGRLMNGCTLVDHNSTQIATICRLMGVLSTILSSPSTTSSSTTVASREVKEEVVRYILSLDIIDHMCSMVLIVHSPLPADSPARVFLDSAMSLMHTLFKISRSSPTVLPLMLPAKTSDLVAAIVIGSVAAIGAASGSTTVTANLSGELILTSAKGLRVLNDLSRIDLKTVQVS